MREIFTIGYGGRTADEFFKLLACYHIKLLVDVRTVPYSGYYADFRKDTLRRKLNEKGIAYKWLKSLGGRPDDKSCFVEGKLDAKRCEEREWYQHGIARLKALARKQRVAIMCSEKDENDCHRKYVVGATLAKDVNFAVVHIDKTGKRKEHAELEAEAKPRQLDLKLF